MHHSIKVWAAAFFLFPCFALGAATTITDNGTSLTVQCNSGEGRWAAYDGGSGYDSGTVTFQYYASWGEWENPCASAADCQSSSGDSGVQPFDLGGPARVRFSTASVAGASADVDAEIICDP